MVFWIAILAGVLFAWLAIRLGFYETWALLFNVVVSIYVAIFLAPLVTEFVPTSDGASSYCVALSMIVLGGGCFAILYGLSYVFLTGQFSVPFPRFFDIVLAGVLGFVTGFLVLSFAALVLTTTPLAQHKIVSTVGFNPQSERPTIAWIAWCCDRVHAVAGFGAHADATQAAVDRLLAKADETATHTKTTTPDANEPAISPRPPKPGSGSTDTSPDTPKP
jgi:hypothetical protein